MANPLPILSQSTIPVITMQATLDSIIHTSSGTTAEDVYNGDVPEGAFAILMKADPNNSGVIYIKTNGTASATDHDMVLWAGQNSDEIIFTTNTDDKVTRLSVITTSSGDSISIILKG